MQRPASPWLLALVLCAIGVSAQPAMSQCFPACNKDNVACLSGPMYNNSRFVAQLRETPAGDGFCTAWIVAAPDCLLTNAHCMPAIGDAVVFNYECANCDGSGGCLQEDIYSVIEVVACNNDQDWCLFRVNADVASLYGQAGIDPRPAVVGLPIYEVHHAEGEKKGYDVGHVDALFMPTGCPGAILEHSVTVIASQGASGSPVFRLDNHCVTAMCNCGPACDDGYVLPMETIWPNIKAVLDTTSCTYNAKGSSGPNFLKFSPNGVIDMEGVVCAGADLSADGLQCGPYGDTIGDSALCPLSQTGGFCQLMWFPVSLTVDPPVCINNPPTASSDAIASILPTFTAQATNTSVNVNAGVIAFLSVEADDGENTGSCPCPDLTPTGADASVSTSGLPCIVGEGEPDCEDDDWESAWRAVVPFTVIKPSLMALDVNLTVLAGGLLGDENYTQDVRVRWALSPEPCSETNGCLKLNDGGLDGFTKLCNVSPGAYTLTVEFFASHAAHAEDAECCPADMLAGQVLDAADVNLNFYPSTGTGGGP